MLYHKSNCDFYILLETIHHLYTFTYSFFRNPKHTHGYLPQLKVPWSPSKNTQENPSTSHVASLFIQLYLKKL